MPSARQGNRIRFVVASVIDSLLHVTGIPHSTFDRLYYRSSPKNHTSGEHMIHCLAAMRAFTALILLAVASAAADSVVIGASKDNTLYTDATGSTSNGAGQYFFTGQSASARRALVAFDISAA